MTRGDLRVVNQEVVVVAGKVVASVRHDLRDVLAAKIKDSGLGNGVIGE